jgi:hypothetical protein
MRTHSTFCLTCECGRHHETPDRIFLCDCGRLIEIDWPTKPKRTHEEILEEIARLIHKALLREGLQQRKAEVAAKFGRTK